MGGFALLTQCGSSQGALPTYDAGVITPVGAYSMDAGYPDVHFVEKSPPKITCDPDASNPCSGGEACCGGFCTDTSLDPENCGACGVACSAKQFCTGTKCDDAVVANVCDNAKATIVLDQYPADHEGGAAIGAALMANCAPATMIATKEEDASGVTYPGDGRPITGVGNTFVAGGGGFGHIGIQYLDSVGVTPLYPQVTGDTYNVIQRSSGTPVISMAFSSLNAHHDYFYLELAVEPISGTLLFAGVGLLEYGTVAAGYYMTTEILPHRENYTKNWYLFEWNDTNNDSIPNAQDSFQLVSTSNE
ncbi:MAG TPA: hypothetical protein VHV30_05910 [Polyangiaceae bacterium]|nr:hypothetical protein [Polyangiaceae bacterium]